MSKSEVFKKRLMIIALVCAVLLAVSALFFGGGSLNARAEGETTETKNTGEETTPEYESKTFVSVTGKAVDAKGTSYVLGTETSYVYEWENGGAELPAGWAYKDLSILRVTVKATQNADKVKGLNVAICDAYSTDRGYNWTVADVSLNANEEKTVDLQMSDDNKFGTLDINISPRRIKFAVVGDEAAADEDKITIDVKVEACKEVQETVVPATEDHVFATQTGTITGGKSDDTASNNNKVTTSTEGTMSGSVLMAYEGARITVDGEKASMITGLRMNFVNEDQKSLWYTPAVTFTDGKNIHYVAVDDMGWNQSPDATAIKNRFNPKWVEIFVKTSGVEEDTCNITVKIEFIIELPDNFDDPEGKNVADYQMWTQTKTDVAGGSTSWIWIDGGTHTVSGYYMRRYEAVKIEIEGDKASMLSSILFTTTMGAAECGYERAVDLKDGKNTLIYDVSEVLKSVPAGSDANKWKAETCRLLIKTAKGEVTDVSDITVTVTFLVTKPELPPEPVESPNPHMMANKKRVVFGAQSVASDLLAGYDESNGGVATGKKLTDFTDVRISLICRKNADKINKLQLDISGDSNPDGVRADITDLSSYDFSDGKGIDIDVAINDMTNYIGEKKDFVPRTLWLRAYCASGATEQISIDVRVYLYHSDKPAPDTEDLVEKPKPEEPPLADISDHTFTTITVNEIAGGNATGTNIAADAQITKSQYLLRRYDRIKVTVSGSKASLVNGAALVFADAEEEPNKFSSPKIALNCEDGKETATLIKMNQFTGSIEYDSEYFIPASLTLVIYTGGEATDKTDLTVKVEFIVLDTELKEDIKLFDFWYKGGTEGGEGSDYHYDKDNDRYIEERGPVTAVYTKNGGKDGESGGCTITAVDCSGANGQVWLTTGGRIIDQNPEDVEEDDKILFDNFGSVDLYLYVEDPQWVENILITFGTQDLTANGAKLFKAIGLVEQAGWQHIRFNIDSMTTQGGFEWGAERYQMVSIEFVVTIRMGTPKDTKVIIDDLWLRTEKCDPKIEMNDAFSLTGTTGKAIDLADSVTATHPFNEEVRKSFGVQFSKTENGAKSPVAFSGTEFTPYKAGYYFVTAMASDSMGASAQHQFTIVVTGEDIDSEDPSISFGNLPQYMAKPGELDLSVIKVTDDIDTDIVPTITVKDADGNELTIADGKVNITKPGIYTITVTATDKAGHTKTLTRNINVEGEAIEEPTADKKKGCGCGSDIAGTSACLAALALIAACAVVLRRKKENN